MGPPSQTGKCPTSNIAPTPLTAPQTRSGATFSPFSSADPLPCEQALQFEALLKESIALEGCSTGEAGEDFEESAATECRNPPAAPAAALKRPPPAEGPSASRQHRKRRRARDTEKARAGHRARAETIATHVRPSAPVQTSLATEDLPAARGAYVAKNETPPGAKKAQEVEDLLAQGFEYIAWNGR